MLLEDDRARDKQEADVMLRAYEVQLKYGSQIDMSEIKAMMDQPRTATPSTQNPVIPEIVPFEPQPPMMPQPPMDAGMMPPDMGMQMPMGEMPMAPEQGFDVAAQQPQPPVI
jgi:hypothetical protein